MLNVLLVCAAVFLILIFAEMAWNKGWLRGEFGRKFVHILVGSFVGFWPLFLTWGQIIGLSISFLIVITISKIFNVFRAIHTVHRPTWGEAFFAAVVGLLAFVTDNGWIYMVALIHMSLADGLAAIIGVAYGKGNQYRALGHIKSIAGTLTFVAISMATLLIYSSGTHAHLAIGQVLLITAGATLLENFSIRGLDNLTVPLWVAFALARLV
jgi:phytol kinase